MNKDNAKDYLPFVQALMNDKNIEMKDVYGIWARMENMGFTEDPSYYRIEKEPEYPVTKLWCHQLANIFHCADCTEEGYMAIANAAIKQAIIDGDVILREKK